MKTETPCVTYSKEEKIGELLVTKIENSTTNASRKIKKFNSLFGIKELLHVIDTYNQTCDRLDIEVAKKWAYFEDVLNTNAKNRWNQYYRDLKDKS